MDRRAFLRSFVKPAPTPRLRPPGAVEERRFLDLCTSCGDCAQACPHAAIFTRVDDGTPVMRPEQQGCHLCDGFPCVEACGEAALLPPETVSFGLVRINPARCFVFRGPECGACAGLCPQDIRGLRLVIGKPVIDEDACVGCGLCVQSCPTIPSAIEFVERP